MKKTNPPKINKNNSTYILNNIKKEKLNETKLLFFNVILMVVVITLVSYITVFAVGKNNIFEKYMEPKYSTHEETIRLISNDIDLNTLSIVSDSVGLTREPIKFKIINKKKYIVNYKIILENNYEKINKDANKDNLIDISNLKYSLDGENINELKNCFYNNQYVIMEGSIASLSTIEFDMRIWAEKSVLEDKNKTYFYGKLLLVES